MNTKKQILIIGAFFLVIFSILFFNLRNEYNKDYNITNQELKGLEEITKIYKLDIVLKSVRGLNQLKDEDTISLKNNLMIDDKNILNNIEQLEDTNIKNLYKQIIENEKSLSKLSLFKEYTKLLKMLNNKRIDKADSSSLLFESDREIYFLITTTILNIPQIIENIGKVRALGVSILNNDSNKKNKNEVYFLLKSNLQAFIETTEKIKYTIQKLDLNNQNKLNSLLNTIISDFYGIKSTVLKVEKHTYDFNSKEYFLDISKLVNKIDSLFITSKDLLSLKLKERKSNLQNNILVGTTLYLILILILIFSIYYNYNKYNIEERKERIKKEQDKFIQKIQQDYIKNDNLKEICNKSLNYIISYFNAINGSLYLYHEENKKLYLGSTYGIKDNTLNQTLDLHENLISENILEKKIKILDINQKINLGTISTNAIKLLIIPIMEFEKSIGTIQLVFDNKFHKIDIDFLTYIINLMGTFIYKARKDEEAKRYLDLIDNNVLISKTDLDGNIIEVSENLCKLSQYTKEELIGKTHRIFKHPDTKKETFVNMWSTITKGDSWTGEIKDKKKDDTAYWVETYIKPDCDINGNIVGYTAIRTDITDKKQIEQIAITDGLTSLYNRRHFDNIFPQQIAINQRTKGLLAFVLIDIDHFKQYNDTYGHQEGDTTLKLVAKALKDTLKRPIDYTFRLGGEEFGLLYLVNDKEDGYNIANKARVNIENLQIEHSGNSASNYVTISSGLYLIDPEDNSTVDDIYLKADQALYKAKHSGRNSISIV